MLIVLVACYYDNEEQLYGTEENCETIDVSYAQEVVPILDRNCFQCHSSQARLGGVILDEYSATLDVVNDGRLEGVIRHEAGFSPMPQNANQLSDCFINLISAWIDQGALNN